jgi:hypothetical protein
MGLYARQEQGAGVGSWPILAVHSEVVSADRTFQTRTRYKVAEVLPKLDDLIDIPISITKICRLRASYVQAKTFCRAAGKHH